jgi:hypothetical protein
LTPVEVEVVVADPGIDGHVKLLVFVTALQL